MGRWVVALAASLMLVGTAGLQTVAGAHGGDKPTVLEDRRPDDASWGLSVETNASGDILFDVYGHGAFEGSRLTMGAVLFGQDRSWNIMLQATFLLSPDRTVVATPVQTVASPGVSEVPELKVDAKADGVGTASHLPPCPADACFFGELDEVPPGPHNVILWMAGMEGTELRVHADNVTDVASNPGEAFVVGDPEVAGGNLNVQAQRTACNDCPIPVTGGNTDARLGVKAIAGAHVSLTAEQELWGGWSATNFKIACQFELQVCPHHDASFLEYQCTLLVRPLLEEHCGTYHISWAGPPGGEHGFQGYTFLGEQGPTPGSSDRFSAAPPGDYLFRIDQAVDLYGPLVYDPTTRTFAFLGEHFVTLSLADVSLPPPSS